MASSFKALGSAALPWLWQRPFTSKHVVSALALGTVMILVTCAFYTSFLYPELFTPLRKIPTPPGRSLLKGTTAPSTATSHAARLRYWTKTVPNDGLLRYYLEGNQERVLVTSVKALQEILVSHEAEFTKPKATKERLRYITGNGLLLAEGEEHKIQRKVLMPSFSFRHIKDLYPVFWYKARQLTQCLEKEVKNNDSSVVVLRGWATRTTLDIIGLAGMDHDFDSLHDPHNNVTQQYQRMRQEPARWEVVLGLVVSLFSPRWATIVSKLPSNRRKQVQEASRYIRGVCRSIIQEKMDKMNAGGEDSKQVDIISVALRSGIFTHEKLVDQMMTFLAAGHGTTSHALQWAVYALCRDIQIQKRLREEIRSRLPSITDDETPISADDLDGLPYLHAFCNEVLRFYPPVPVTVREALHDTSVGGYHIPRGTTFTIAPGVTNLDPELWGPDADKFDPERWMRKGCANTGGVRTHFGFLTFIHGPRSCIGSTFAKSELTCLVAALVGRFHMELENPDKSVESTKRGIGAAPGDGVRVRLEVLDGW
ncbi:Cytochrome P450 monooxygenase FSL4 [Exophiala dermatitidis]